MSQRMGQADGRCFTINTSSQLFNDYLMKRNNINYADNYSYRKLLQSQGPSVLKPVTDQQQINSKDRVSTCDKPLLNVSDIY